MKERFFKKAVKFINFSFIGTTTFAMQLFFTVMLTEVLSFTYYVSHGIGLALAWSINFMCNMKLTFGIEDHKQERLARFILIAVAISIFNWILVLLLVEFMQVHYFMSIILVTVSMSVVTFATEEMWVFNKTRRLRAHPQHVRHDDE